MSDAGQQTPHEVDDGALRSYFDTALSDLGDVGRGVRLTLLDDGPPDLEPCGAPDDEYPALRVGAVDATVFLPRSAGQPRAERPDPTSVVGGEQGFVGLARWLLEMHRTSVQARGVYAFTNHAQAAIARVYEGTGLGGAVLFNSSPMRRAAAAAAAQLVTRIYGPQVGWLRHPYFGQVFRVEREAVADLRDLVKPTVAFAAVWADAVQRYAASPTDLSPIRLLPLLDREAPAWWDRLAASESFRRLADAVVAFSPTPEEIAAAAGHEQDAWSHVQALVDRAVEVGVDIIDA